MITTVILTIILGVVIADWTSYKVTYRKNYASTDEDIRRYNIFKARVVEIEEHNELYKQGLVTYFKGINMFTDMTDDEIKVYTHGLIAPKDQIYLNNLELIKFVTDAPDSIDWRDKGALTEVKFQGECGSCWAFSSTGAIEAHMFIYRNKSVCLSEQNLVDCVTKNSGCSGGWPSIAFDYVKDNKGIDSETSYPYEAIDTKKCRYNATNSEANVTGVVILTQYDEISLQDAVGNIGPVSVCIDARYLGSYEGGIFSSEDCDPEELTHAVLVVGYGSENGKDYWIIRNSWGDWWGEDGYFKLARNDNNMCGVATMACYPQVK